MVTKHRFRLARAQNSLDLFAGLHLRRPAASADRYRWRDFCHFNEFIRETSKRVR
jgi:hypothetical protein